MEIKRQAVAGTLESNDCYIMVFANESREIELESIVLLQFEQQILKVVHETLDELDCHQIKVVINDKGALDFTIKARLITAIKRGMQDA